MKLFISILSAIFLISATYTEAHQHLRRQLDATCGNAPCEPDEYCAYGSWCKKTKSSGNCAIHEECTSGLCSNYECMREVGTACESDSVCMSGRCHNLVCELEPQFFVKTISGKIWTLDFDQDDTIGEVKIAIEEITGIPMNYQLLVFKGKTLEDAKTLNHYSIQEDAIIYLHQRPGSR